MNQKKDINVTKSISFEEVHHSKAKLDIEKYKILDSQAAIDEVYHKIMAQSNAVRHAPIPGYEENSCLMAVRFNLKKENDLQINDLQENNGQLIVKYKEYNSTEFPEDDLSSPVVILRISGACNIKNIQFINN